MRVRTAAGIAIILVMCVLVLAGALQSMCREEQRIMICGSSCMEEVCRALAEAYELRHPGILVEVQLGGSSMGILNTRSGVADLGASSRELAADETGLEEHLLAIDAIAVVTNETNPVSGLSLEELRDIFSGQISNWKELGGEDLPVVVIGREAGSGTRDAFEQMTGLRGKYRFGQELTENGLVRTACETVRGAIGYLSANYAGEHLRILEIEGACPDQEAILSGRYPLTRPFLLLTKSENQNPLVRDFLSFATGEEGCAVLEKLGLIPDGNAAQGNGDMESGN